MTTPAAATESGQDPSLDAWRAGVKIQPVSGLTGRHVIHSYFNTCPESPDGKYVLYFTSGEPSGELGDLRIRERATGQETILVENIATEDAHRVACQQWSNNGKTVVYHAVLNGRWQVVAIDVATLQRRVLVEDRQLGFGSQAGALAPVYGCHWNPGPHRNLEAVDVETGEVSTLVEVGEVTTAYADFTRTTFGTNDLSLFFPVMSPDETKVMFKLSRPGGSRERGSGAAGGTDFKSPDASLREGKIIYDRQARRLLGLQNQWGHPSWAPDSRCIFEKGNFSFDIVSGATTHYAPSCISDHPSIAPGGAWFATDGKVTRHTDGRPDEWGIAIGSMTKDDWVVLMTFDNSRGARTWRHNHPHPAFSADGQRVYFNVNDGPWTRLMVAERAH